MERREGSGGARSDRTRRGATGVRRPGGRRPPTRRGLRARLFAWSLAHAGDADRRLYGDRKARLFEGVGGTVVEIGAGAGPNADHLAPGTRWLVAEPNVHFHAGLRRRAAARGLRLELLGGDAQALPLPDASADAVVSTLVLCSVADPAAALAEARRVLRPGGRLVFLEHVAGKGALGRWQRRLRVPWGWLADGCDPHRDTAAAIQAAGFEHVEMERFRAPLGLVAPHIAGTATAP